MMTQLTYFIAVAMLELVDEYLEICVDRHKISSQLAEKNQSIAKLLIISCTVILILLILLFAYLNNLFVTKLQKQMKYYSDTKVGSEAFLPLPGFLEERMSNQIGDMFDVKDSTIEQDGE